MSLALKKIDHIAIICPHNNYFATKDFYIKILGCAVLQEIYREDRESFKLDLKIGDYYQIELFSFPNPPFRPTKPEATGLRHIAFQVSDLDQAIIFLEQNNIKVEPVRVDKTRNNIRFTFFFDPNGQPLELCELLG